jgi:hypothetical protein
VLNLQAVHRGQCHATPTARTVRVPRLVERHNSVIRIIRCAERTESVTMFADGDWLVAIPFEWRAAVVTIHRT